MPTAGQMSSWLTITVIPCLIGAALLYFYGDRGLWAWGWTVLVLVAALELAGILLRNFEPGLLLHSRRLRTQLELELALFGWTVRQRVAAGDDTDVLRALRAARRAARGTPMVESIDRVHDTIARGDATANLGVGDELEAALAKLSSNSTSRLPLGRGWMLPPSCIVPASVAAAFLGVILFPVSGATNTLTPAALLEGLVLCGLAYAALRLAMVASFKLHSAVSQKTFRVVMVSAREEASALGSLAFELYAHISHFVVIHVNDEVDGHWRSTLAGTYHVFVREAGLIGALNAFAGNADMIVLDAEGAAPELAATVKAVTKLPASRYLALGASETVPPGYLWVEPMSLRVNPSDRRARSDGVDFYLLGAPSGRALWHEWLALVLLLFGLLLLGHGGVWLAALFLIAAIGRVLPNHVVPWRRATISRSTLRVPRALEFSRRLVPRVLGFRLAWGWGLLVVVATLLVQLPIGIAWGEDPYHQQLLPLKLAYVMLASFVILILESSTLFILKWSIDWNFRFLVLRRNSSRFAYGHKVSVMATCGRYGQVVSLRDDTFDQTDQGYGENREAALGSWFQIFSEIESTLRPVAFVHAWQRQVLLELEVVDFAVFDWIDEITDNMRWELRSAGERLPAHRIVVIHNPQNRSDVDSFLASCGDVFAQRPHCLELSRGPDDEYFWSNHSEFDRAFGAGLHRALSALAVEPRGTHPRETIGTWPYPRRAD
jgi:hypothetical protein